MTGDITMKKLIILAAVSILLGACGDKEKSDDMAMDKGMPMKEDAMGMMHDDGMKKDNMGMNDSMEVDAMKKKDMKQDKMMSDDKM